MKKLKYGARVLLSRKGGEAETIDVRGRPTVIMHGGDGPPFVYLHSTLGESFRWLPFYQAWAKQFTRLRADASRLRQERRLRPDRHDRGHGVPLRRAVRRAWASDEVILGGVSLGGWIAAEFAVRWPERVKKLWLSDAPGLWVDEEPLADLFRVMHDRDELRELLFHDPEGHMAKLVIEDDADEEKLLAAYQSMTVLARLVWERPYDPKLRRPAAPRPVSDAAAVGRERPAGAAGLRRGVPEVPAARADEADPRLRPPADVREGAGVRGGGCGVLQGVTRVPLRPGRTGVSLAA